MERLAWVCLAGAAGTGARYLVNSWAGQRFGPGFPIGTLLVNVSGCFLIALLMQVTLNTASFPVNLRFALTSGFLGGLTTYSSFNQDTIKLYQDGAIGWAALNFALTIGLCLLAGLLGLVVGARVTSS